jgi:hypothetical protein
MKKEIRYSEELVPYLERNPESEPNGLNIVCPVCGADAGVWCAVCYGTTRDRDTRIGFLHRERVKGAEG